MKLFNKFIQEKQIILGINRYYFVLINSLLISNTHCKQLRILLHISSIIFFNANSIILSKFKYFLLMMFTESD